MNQVILLFGHTASGLAVARSLWNKGVCVKLIDHVGFSATSFSRAVSHTWRVSSIYSDSDKAAEEVRRCIASEPRSLVLPTTDEGVLFAEKYKTHFGHHVLAIPDREKFELVSDKQKTILLAQQLGIEVPKTILPGMTGDHFVAEAHDLYPCVVKATRSKSWDEAGNLKSGGEAEILLDEKSLVQAIERFRSKNISPIIQEFVSGVGCGVYVYCRNGDVKMVCAQERLREGNPRGSGASCAQTVDVPKDQYDATVLLMRALNWNGPAMVEFKRGRKSILMEINGRFWNSLPLTILAGLDIPGRLAADYGVFLRSDEENTAKIGVRSRDLVADLVHLCHVIKGPPRGWPGKFPSRLNACVGVVKDFSPFVGSYVYSLSDPLPGIVHTIIPFLRLVKR